jgi:exodeoxyribonuclease VII small subunit
MTFRSLEILHTRARKKLERLPETGFKSTTFRAVRQVANCPLVDPEALPVIPYRVSVFSGWNSMPKPAPHDKPEKPESFEAAIVELEGAVASMESGQLSLEQSLAAYKRGAELLQYCQSALQAAEQQVKILEENTLKPFAAPET